MGNINGVFDADQLKLFVERIERLEEEKKGIADDIKDVFSDAKANGLHPGTMRKCIALRKLPKQKRDDDESLLDAYKDALGLSFDSTPLGEAIDNLDRLADEGDATISLQTGEGETIAEFGSEAKKRRGKGKQQVEGSAYPPLTAVPDSHVQLPDEKPKRGRPKKVRDPSDGTERLVTVPAAANG